MIFFAIPSFAQEMYQYSVSAEIFENNVHYQLNLIFVNYTSNTFYLTIIGSQSNLIVNTTANCTVESKVLGADINCNFSGLKDRIDLIIEYDSNENLKKKDNYFIFTHNFRSVIDVKTLFVIVKLPEGMGLLKKDKSYTPENALLGSDGRRTILAWQKNNFKAGEHFDVSVAFEKIGVIQDFSKLISLNVIGIIIIIIFAIILYKYFLSAKFSKVILPVLKKDEKIIFESILKHGNGVNQKIVVKESNYSKAKVSKLLKSLQERGLIKLERLGRSNKIYIVKDFGKK